MPTKNIRSADSANEHDSVIRGVCRIRLRKQRSSSRGGFEPTVGAGPYITAESDWNAYNIPTSIFLQ